MLEVETTDLTNINDAMTILRVCKAWVEKKQRSEDVYTTFKDPEMQPQFNYEPVTKPVYVDPFDPPIATKRGIGRPKGSKKKGDIKSL